MTTTPSPSRPIGARASGARGRPATVARGREAEKPAVKPLVFIACRTHSLRVFAPEWIYVKCE
eukprot:4984349-Pyramimonas_sp.AAC.1